MNITGSLVEYPRWDDYAAEPETTPAQSPTLAQPPITTEQPAIEPPHQNRVTKLATRITEAVGKGSKNFAIGATVILPYTAVNIGQMYLSGMLKEDDAIFLRTWPCVAQTICKQYGVDFTIQTTKLLTLYNTACITPLHEEGLYRRTIQEQLLWRMPRYIVKKIAPGKEVLLDSNFAKAARIVATSLYFAHAHFANEAILGKSITRRNVIGAFGIGLICGTLKESKAGMMGALGAHMMNNMLATARLLDKV